MIGLVGIRTKAAAQRATRWGGIACFVQAARMTLGNIISVSNANKPLDNAIAWFFGASLIPILYIAAGVHLRRGEGWKLSSFAATVFAMDLVFFGPSPSSFQNAGALAIRTVLFLFMLNAARSAWALSAADENYPANDATRPDGA